MGKELINKHSSLNTKRLYKYLWDIYGQSILSGQQTSQNGKEYQVIYEATGKFPAVRGFDFMDYSSSRAKYGARSDETEQAIKWWEQNGIVTFCWHFNAPTDLINESPEREWYRGFYTVATRFNLEEVLENPKQDKYQLLINDLDIIANELKKLQDHGVPVLWRPFHEASGKWFWWGAYGPLPFIKLWKLMYHRFTDFHQLNNLIWVWNGQDKDWYPGDSYVDIIGEDIYSDKQNYTSQLERFNTAKEYTTENKMIALTENGTIPDPELLIKDHTYWSWFCTWCGTFVYNKNGEYNEEYTDLEMLKKVYQHSYVITKEQLPNLKEYSID